MPKITARPDLIPIGRVPHPIHRNKYLDRSTIHRYVTRGVNGVKLRVVRLAGRCFIDPDDLAEFYSRVNPPLA